jgi:hypothetical protein
MNVTCTNLLSLRRATDRVASAANEFSLASRVVRNALVPAVTAILLAAGCGSNTKSGTDAARDTSVGKDALVAADLPASVGLDAGAGPDASALVDSGTTAPPDTASVDLAASPDAASRDVVAIDAGGATPDTAPGPAVDSAPGADALLALDGGADLAQPDAAVAADAAPDATTVSSGKIGVVILTQSVQTLPVVGTFVASGGVAQFGFKSGSSSCTPTTQGACQLYTCTTTSDDNVDPATLVQAGDVTIKGLGADLVLPYMSAQSGYFTSSQGYLWTSSKAATVTVSGSAQVPAFSLGVTTPNPITVTSPVAQIGSTGATYTISRSGDLAVTWTGGVNGTVNVTLSSSDAPAGSASISCMVDASAGAVTVPGAFMSQLGTTGGFVAGVTSYTSDNVGDWLMLFEASSSSAQGVATFTN